MPRPAPDSIHSALNSSTVKEKGSISVGSNSEPGLKSSYCERLLANPVPWMTITPPW